MKVFIETYGCTYNQADSQIMAGLLKDNNIDLTDNIEDADVIIVNTCYVKLPTENKVTYRIQKLQKEFPDKKVIVGGCMVEIDGEKRCYPEYESAKKLALKHQCSLQEIYHLVK